MTSVRDNITPWSVCACGAKKPRDARNCGVCPQRRASELESHNAATVEPIVLLPTCDMCGHDIIPALGSMAPCPAAIENSIAKYGIADCECTPRHYMIKNMLTCLQCSLKKVFRCECPKHGGKNEFPSLQYLSHFAWISANVKDKGTAYKKLCCYKCHTRYKLESWSEYCVRNGNVSPDGEVIILPGAQTTLSLSSAQSQYDPLAQYGGMVNCWMPRKGIEGTYRKVDGVMLPNWIAFLPKRYVHIPLKNTSHRVMVGTRYNPTDLLPDLNVTMSSLWHPSVNAAVDLILDPSGKSHPTNLLNVGFLYVRVLGLVPGTERHDLRIHRYNDHIQEFPGCTIREWVEWNHNQ
jgi:hypothetical protein